MAKNEKPSSNLIEAEYKVLDGYPKSHTTNNLTGLFDGYQSTGAGYYGGLTYNEIGWVEIQLLEPGVFYRYVIGEGPSSNFQILKNKNGKYIDVTDTYLINDNATGREWYLFTNPMPPGIYKFIGKTTNSSYDTEWFIEKSKCVKFLILDNGIYKTYDSINHTLIEFTEDISEMFNENSSATFITELNDIKDLLTPNMKIVSNINFSTNIKSIKSTKQLFIGNGDFSTRLADNIDYFKFKYNLSDENCIIRTVVSTDSGNTWKSYVEGKWVNLYNNVSIKNYNDLSEEEKSQWNVLLDEILEKGIDIQDVENIDFNTLDAGKLRFAYAIQIQDANSIALVENLKWQFDSIGTYSQLNPKTDVDINMSNNNISIKPLKDIELMKINVGISSQAPPTIDTSGLVDKETFNSRGQIYISNTQPPNMRNGDFWIKQERLLE